MKLQIGVLYSNLQWAFGDAYPLLLVREGWIQHGVYNMLNHLQMSV